MNVFRSPKRMTSTCDALARLEGADDALERAHALDRLAVDGDDDVTDFDARPLRRAGLAGEAIHATPRISFEAGRLRVLRRDFADRDAEHRAANAAMRDEVVHHLLASVIGIAKP